MGKKNQEPDLGSGMNIPDHISESLETICRVKNTLMRIRTRDSESLRPWFQDPGWKNLDPQHCFCGYILFKASTTLTRKFLLSTDLPWLTFSMRGSAELPVAPLPFPAFSNQQAVLRIRIRDPGSSAFLTLDPDPGSGTGFFLDPGSQPHIF
jgi:hypothetical protein